MLEWQTYMLDRFFEVQQSQLLCDNQDLACTPKDPPRRGNMKDMSFRENMEQFIE